MNLKHCIFAACLGLAATGSALAADLSPMPVKAKPVADLPFFLINDNVLTYSYQFSATSPGATNRTAKNVLAFTHFDVWAYGTNFANFKLLKSDKNDPAAPCGDVLRPMTGCAGAVEFFGVLRSTLGWNEIFNTKAFSYGALNNISFEVGADIETENQFAAPAKKAVVAGLLFAFDLPYKGYFNVAPLYYKEWNHNIFVMPAYAAPFPGVVDGNVEFRGTWALEINYYMELGFLPENLQYFAISGRAGFYGPKGTGAADGILSPINNTKMEINSEPIRLTFDASKLFWGPTYSHFVDVWVAYRYWQNKFGLNDKDVANNVCFGNAGTAAAVNNGSCKEESLTSGISVKF